MTQWHTSVLNEGITHLEAAAARINQLS